jgi:thioredoxin reductase (NADPH)
MQGIERRLVVIACLIAVLVVSVRHIDLHRSRLQFDISKLNTVQNLIPVVIIGSGPAGLSAAVYTARAKYNTVILGGDFGGQLSGVKYIENWPGREPSTGLEIMEDIKLQAEKFGAQMLDEKATSIDTTDWPFKVQTDNNQTLYACSIILSTGGIAKRLNVPGVEEYWGKGVGSCTICEAPLYKDKQVAIVGGGDTAGDRALQLAAQASKVYMIVKGDQLDAIATVQDYIKSASNIDILYNTQLENVVGDNDWVTGVSVKHSVTKQEKKLPVSGIYFAIGYHPNSELVKNKVALDSEGFIELKGVSQETSIRGIYAAGNVAVSDKQYGKGGVATGSGIKAAMDTLSFFNAIGFTFMVTNTLQPQFFKVKV